VRGVDVLKRGRSWRVQISTGNHAVDVRTKLSRFRFRHTDKSKFINYNHIDMMHETTTTKKSRITNVDRNPMKLTRNSFVTTAAAAAAAVFSVAAVFNLRFVFIAPQMKTMTMATWSDNTPKSKLVPVDSAGRKKNKEAQWNVTAIIPVCNRPNHLQDAVESAFRQSYPIYEIIIAIDSGDKCFKNTTVVYDLFQNPRFEKLSSSEPEIKAILGPGCDDGQEDKCGGPIARARNAAVKEASPYTTHYAMLDDDDIWLPNKNEIQLGEMEKQGFKMSASDAFYSPDPLRDIRCIDPTTSISQMNFSKNEKFARLNTGKHRKTIFRKLGLNPKDPDEVISNVTLGMLRIHSIFITSSVMIAKCVFQLFDENIKYHRTEDYEFWLRILGSGNVPGALYFSDPLVFYESSRRRTTCY
jgi:hypothetical protein